jgi:rhodanese-related sulfurtransferase
MIRILLFISCLSYYFTIQAQVSELLAPESFARKMKCDKGYLLDVRADWEFETGKLDGAVNADIHSDKFRMLVDKLNPDKKCYVYCFSGNRSHEAVAYLMSKGFQRVYDLQGGIVAWQKAGLPIVK